MRISEKVCRAVIILMSIAATAVCALPLMSAYLSEGESCTMVIRGVNLTEFSAWGCVPLLAALLIPVILFGCQSKFSKEVELICLLMGNMVCYTHGINASREWLCSLDGSLLTYYPGLMLYLCAFIAAWALAWAYNRGFVNKPSFDKSEEVLNEQSSGF